jgi:4-hydroxy-tetrahydrodipicolinate synthase
MVPDGPTAWHGIYAATLTPLRPDFMIDEAALAAHVARVAGTRGVVGVMCNGHAGENHLLTREEKRRVTEVVVEAIGTRAIVVCGVNAESSLEAALHARDAEHAGADAVMVFAPNGWALGQDEHMAYRHHRAILEAADLPMMLFQASVCAGKMAYSRPVLAELLRLPRVVAIKEGSWEVAAYEATRRLAAEVAPQVAVMASGDEHLFTGFAIGSEGSVVSLAAVVPEVIVALDRAVRRGELGRARAIHEALQPLANLVYGTPPGARATARLKACLHMLGRIPCDAVRPPFAPIDAAERARLQVALERAMAAS